MRWPICFLLLAGILLPLPGLADATPDKMTTFFVGRLNTPTTMATIAGVWPRNWAISCRAPRPSPCRTKRKSRLADSDELFATPFLFIGWARRLRPLRYRARKSAPLLCPRRFHARLRLLQQPRFPHRLAPGNDRVYPGESVQKIPYDHLIYHSFYSLDRVENIETHQDILLDGALTTTASSSPSCARMVWSARSPWATNATRATASIPRRRASSRSISRSTR